MLPLFITSKVRVADFSCITPTDSSYKGSFSRQHSSVAPYRTVRICAAKQWLYVKNIEIAPFWMMGQVILYFPFTVFLCPRRSLSVLAPSRLSSKGLVPTRLCSTVLAYPSMTSSLLSCPRLFSHVLAYHCLS
jgi:hypothetical protein